MKRHSSLKLCALFSSFIISQMSADRCEGPLYAKRWYVMPKAGVAAGIFTKRGHEQQVIPHAGVRCPITVVTTATTTLECSDILVNPENVLQENCCKIAKFNDMFSNGVVHVGGEFGYIAGEHCVYFVDLLYNYARGHCVRVTSNNMSAPDGCGNNAVACNNSLCDNPLSTVVSPRVDTFGNYSAFSAYVGNRYYFNRMCCDRFALFLGLKAGFMHRKSVAMCSTFPAVITDGATVFNERSTANTAFCSSNAVSTGVQFGGDYEINSCLALMIGVEVVATAPFKANRNINLNIPQPISTATDQFAYDFPTNLILGGTGTFVQFPVWVGLRWQWSWKDCCD